MPIDMHAHWIPRELSQALRQRTQSPCIGPDERGNERLVCYRGTFSLPLEPDFDDLEKRIGDMERNGITHSVLSLTTYGVEGLPVEEALPLCRIFNDAVSSICSRYPERFSALASLPVSDLDVALAEFKRAMSLPGIVGALLPADGFLSLKRAERFSEIFSFANDRSAVMLIHYGSLPDDPAAPKPDISDNSADRIATLDMQARISSSMVTLCFTDFLNRYPEVSVLSHNLGGNIPYEIDRLDFRILADKRPDVLPSERIRQARILVDCNSRGAKPLEQAVATYGADKIVIGTDGTDFGMRWALRSVNDARISDAERFAILDGNAKRAIERVKTRQPQTA